MKKNYIILLFASIIGIVISSAIPSFGGNEKKTSHPSFARSTDTLYKILFIGKLNTDCYDDTVVAAISKNQKIAWRGTPTLPKYIFWGKSSSKSDKTHNKKDTAHSKNEVTCTDTVGGIIADTHKVQYSIIRYPSFVGLRGSVSFMKLNTNDEIYDIVSMLWGKTDTSSSKRDTTTSFAVFGRKGLDTLQELPFYSIDTMQRSPITAMKLNRFVNFTSPARRDFSGRMSYFITRVVLPVIADTAEHKDSNIRQILAGVNLDAPLIPEFKVYPNPSVNLTTIVGHKLEKGTYTINVLTETGFLVCTQNLISTSGEDVVFPMDVSSFSTGYYVFTVSSQKGAVGSYPVLIIH